MDKIWYFTKTIPKTRKIQITLPNDTPPGIARLKVTVLPENQEETKTLGDLLNSEFFGLWRDREDIDDSNLFARQLREAAWSRNS